MFKDKKHPSLAVSLLFTAPVYHGDEGSVKFTPVKLLKRSEIHQDDIDKEVELVQVTTSHINQSHHSDAVAVDLRLVSCDLENSSNGSVARFLKLQMPLIARENHRPARFSTTPARVSHRRRRTFNE